MIADFHGIVSLDNFEKVVFYNRTPRLSIITLWLISNTIKGNIYMYNKIETIFRLATLNRQAFTLGNAIS